MADATESRPAERLKRGLGLTLLLFAVVALVVGVYRERAISRAAAEIEVEKTEAAAVTVFYFHGDERCRTCNKIEAETERVVSTRFAAELASGELVLKVVNFDRPENLHYRDDYQLAFGTVLVRGRGEEAAWKNLEEVWDHVNADPPAFEDYLVANLRQMLESGR
ncbi:MAG: hypothetical protein H6807_06580 [Planctomycetes bacterium]|nr:hypothetical protein [Planctomycetota bacterium]